MSNSATVLDFIEEPRSACRVRVPSSMLWFLAVCWMSFLGCQLGGLARGDHPADDVAAVDVDDRVERVPDALVRTAELGDVPSPYAVGDVGEQFGDGLGRMGGLAAPVAADLAVLAQDPIHRRGGRQVGA